MGFTENFIQAYQAGKAQARQKEQDAKDEELRKLQIDALKQEQKRIEIEGRYKAFQRSREGVKDAADASQGLPIDQLVEKLTYGAMQPSGEPQAEGQPAPLQGRPMPLPMKPTAQALMGQRDPSALPRKTFQMPGSEEFGAPGYSIQPKSVEELIAAQTAAKVREIGLTPTKVGVGEQVVLPSTGQVIAQGAPKEETRSIDVQAADALARGDNDTYQRLMQVKNDMRPPPDPTLAAIRDAQLALLRQQGQGLSNEQFNRIQSISNDYDTASKDYVSRVQSWQGIQAALGQASAAGDMAGVFTFMKSLDPTSTVREGEYANAQNAAGVDDRIRNYYNKALSGQILSPEQRADFLKTAKGQFSQARTRQEGLMKLYTARAQAAGVPPDQVVIDYDDVFGLNAPQGGTVPMVAPDGRQLQVPADQVEEAKARGAQVVQ